MVGAAGPIVVPAETKRTLLALLERELRRGYRHVALRHFLMLRATGSTVPPDLEARCAELLATCPSKVADVLLERLQEWMEMLHARSAPTQASVD